MSNEPKTYMEAETEFFAADDKRLEPYSRAMTFEAGWDARNPEVAALTAQLQAAQATLAAIRSIGARSGTDINAWNKAFDVLDDADTSAYDAAILAAKAEGWQNCISKFASYGHLVKGAALDRAESENPYVDDPYRASIEQTEADRG